MKLSIYSLATGYILCFLTVSPVLAATQTVVDSVADHVKKAQNNDYNLPAPAVWNDIVGPENIYDTEKIDIHFDGSIVNFAIHTYFNDTFEAMEDGHSYNVYRADFAIDVDQDGFYEYGLVLFDHAKMIGNDGCRLGSNSPTAGNIRPGLYRVRHWDTSADFFDESDITDKNHVRYAYSYDKNREKRIPVALVPDCPDLTRNTFTVDTKLSEDRAGFIHTFSFDTKLLKGFTGTFDFLWGTATCGNDLIRGTVKRP